MEGVRGPGCLAVWGYVSSLKVMDGGTLVTKGTDGRLKGVESHYSEDSFLTSWEWYTERATEGQRRQGAILYPCGLDRKR